MSNSVQNRVPSFLQDTDTKTYKQSILMGELQDKVPMEKEKNGPRA